MKHIWGSLLVFLCVVTVTGKANATVNEHNGDYFSVCNFCSGVERKDQAKQLMKSLSTQFETIYVMDYGNSEIYKYNVFYLDAYLNRYQANEAVVDSTVQEDFDRVSVAVNEFIAEVKAKNVEVPGSVAGSAYDVLNFGSSRTAVSNFIYDQLGWKNLPASTGYLTNQFFFNGMPVYVRVEFEDGSFVEFKVADVEIDGLRLKPNWRYREGSAHDADGNLIINGGTGGGTSDTGGGFGGGAGSEEWNCGSVEGMGEVCCNSSGCFPAEEIN